MDSEFIGIPFHNIEIKHTQKWIHWDSIPINKTMNSSLNSTFLKNWIPVFQCYSLVSQWIIGMESQSFQFSMLFTGIPLKFLNGIPMNPIFLCLFSMLWNGIKCFQCDSMRSHWIIWMASKWFRCFLERNPSVFNVIQWDPTELLEWHPNEFNVALNRIPFF